MRVILGGLAALAISTNAWSADLLRGSAPAFGEARSYGWAGVYIGAQVGTAHADLEFSESVRPIARRLLRESIIERDFIISDYSLIPNGNGRAASYGGFVGYNSQWGDIVLGAELNYNRTSISDAGSDVIERIVTLSATDVVRVLVASQASAKLTDYGSLRFRAGYAYNWFMPYAMVGIAAGRADVSRSILIDQTDELTGQLFRLLTDTQTKDGAISIGYTAGVGVDIGLMPGVFMRAEYEFMQLGGFDNIPVRVNTGRLALGVKF
jgi:opacity protein-like surface antigen